MYNEITLKKGAPRTLSSADGSRALYTFTYLNVNAQSADEEGGRLLTATVQITTPDGQQVQATPGLLITPSDAGPAFTHLNVAVPELRDKETNAPGVFRLTDQMDANNGLAKFEFSLPDAKAPWLVPLEVTYKPWINLVWVGVIVMGMGVFLAMVRRALEARKVADGPLAGRGSRASDLAGVAFDDSEDTVDTASRNPETAAVERSNGKSGHAPAKPRQGRTPSRP